MDAHFFRILASELIDLLEGGRMEKIHGPLPGVFVFTIFAAGNKRRLIFRHERKSPLLFFSEQRLTNPPRPTAAVMRLRKYAADRRLGKGMADFASRRMAFPLPGVDTPCWLLLDMAEGAFVVNNLPPDFAQPTLWPKADVIDTLCGTPWRKGERAGPWQEYAVLTPFLRETLSELPAPEGRALMVDLEAGGGDVFLYADAAGKPALYSAWPLPPMVLSRRSLDPKPLPLVPADAERVAFLPWAAEASLYLPEHPALAATLLTDESRLFTDVAATAKKEESKPALKASKKQERLLNKLDKERERLQGMLALREDAKALQAVLWQYPADARLEHVEVPDEGGVRLIRLDPLMSVRDNMAHMFKQSARGARGLAMLVERRADALRGLPEQVKTTGTGKESGAEDQNSLRTGVGARPAPSGPGQKEYPGVARFISSDGFVLLRGKNAKGNHSLLKIGSGHDLWLHALDGPSAHLLIRRSHAAEEVPERTQMEAAALVAEKSRHRYGGKAEIMTALLRHVHPVKGAKPGTVRVDAQLPSLLIDVIPSDEAETQDDVQVGQERD